MDDPLHPSFLLLGAKKRFPQHNKRALPSCHSGSKAHTVDFVSGQAHKLWPLLCNCVFRLCIFSKRNFTFLSFVYGTSFKRQKVVTKMHTSVDTIFHIVLPFIFMWHDHSVLSQVSLFDFLETSKPSMFRLFIQYSEKWK